MRKPAKSRPSRHVEQLRALQGQWAFKSLEIDGAPRLDESACPVAIDYLNIGKGPRVVSRGILAWVGADIRVCMAKAGDPRPGEFSSEPGSGRTLSVWRRAKARTGRAPAP